MTMRRAQRVEELARKAYPAPGRALFDYRHHMPADARRPCAEARWEG
jgi:hypothetical protein